MPTGTKKAGWATAATAAAGWLVWIGLKGPVAPGVPPAVFYDGLVLAGSPAALLLALFLGMRRPREAGALLLLGASLASLGLGIRPAVYARDFFLAFPLAVAPSLVAGTLLMAAGRTPSPGVRARKPGKETKGRPRP